MNQSYFQAVFNDYYLLVYEVFQLCSSMIQLSDMTCDIDMWYWLVTHYVSHCLSRKNCICALFLVCGGREYGVVSLQQPARVNFLLECRAVGVCDYLWTMNSVHSNILKRPNICRKPDESRLASLPTISRCTGVSDSGCDGVCSEQAHLQRLTVLQKQNIRILRWA